VRVIGVQWNVIRISASGGRWIGHETIISPGPVPECTQSGGEQSCCE
jgi:hypothetical protein